MHMVYLSLLVLALQPSWPHQVRTYLKKWMRDTVNRRQLVLLANMLAVQVRSDQVEPHHPYRGWYELMCAKGTATTAFYHLTVVR